MDSLFRLFSMKSFRTVTDQMGRKVVIPQPVKRIVSVVPSQSELLIDLGLEEMLAGVTKFCIHPAGMKERVGQIGGTKAVKIDRVVALQPDLVIGNKEENLQSDIEELEKRVPVWMSDIHDLDSALEMIHLLGDLTDTVKLTNQLTASIRKQFSDLNDFIETSTSKRVLYLIWRKPYMAAGKGTFINDCLERCGWTNCLNQERYPEVDLLTADPEVIFLSSEPYPFADKHISELQQHFPNAKIVLVDGEYFSWYGSRMLGAPAYFKNLIEQLRSDQ